MSTIDAHTHSHLRGHEDLAAMARAGVSGVVTCAYLPVSPSHPATVRDLWRWLLGAETARLRGAGLAARVAIGLHPRCVPAAGVDELLRELGDQLGRDGAAALGEVGLESASAAELELLERQLRLAARAGVPAIVHTPRGGKEPALRAILDLLAAAPLDPARVVVDHLTPELVPRVRAIGAWCGLTVQPGKATPADVEAVIRAHGPDGLMVNSDLSQAPSDPLTLPRVADHLRRAGLDEASVTQVTRGNAARLFGF